MSNTHDYTYGGSAYSPEEWEASARYAEEHGDRDLDPVAFTEWLWEFTQAGLRTQEKQQAEARQQSQRPRPNDLAQHIFDTMTAQNKALAAYWRAQR